ncbi:ab-hydrolase associated lipase region [Onchocerca flexuosa]|uniref:Ab-hydrolase associated lipase region n=1 Tax=Onchocerca flexuosa TaxID=387005 RepID=A0A238BZT6_9BILA|nr:ab-hydrolase associated lipase region [Onchocerca flexuosa]
MEFNSRFPDFCKKSETMNKNQLSITMINLRNINMVVTIGTFLVITPTPCFLDIPPEAKMTTVEIILYHGYPVQVFHAHTIDGYILELHRIPFGKNNSFTKRKYSPPVFLQHGLLGSSADWVENLPNESFGIFPMRTSDELFWKFSWDQMAKFDLDAMFDVALNETKQSSLYYVGFSQGTLILFAKLSQDPDFSSKIRKFFALAPIGTVAHVKGLLRLFATKLFPTTKILFISYNIHIIIIQRFFGTKFFMANSKLSKILSISICKTYFFNPLCSNVLFQIAGPESNQFNKSRLVVYIAGEGGTSVMNIIHWMQMVNSEKMQAYNYDSVEENQIHYGRDSPPIYNISSINVPIYLYWSKNDWLANAADIEKWRDFGSADDYCYQKSMITIVFTLLTYVELYQITNAFSIKSLPEATMTTLEIVTYYGYPSEMHTVTTDDGYILELHRIPSGKTENRTGNESKSVVFLQHGFIGSSAVWVTNLPNQSAAFIFADAGFDVWMGNVRGNTYSTKHVNYTQNDLKYWNFTSILSYFLFISFFHFNFLFGFVRIIRKFFALGPISTMAYIKGLIKIAATKFFQPLKMLIKISGNFMANKSLLQKISKSTCSLKSIVEHCENIMFQMIGPPNVRMNMSRIPVYMSHIPAGTSTANVLHWAQMVNSHKIQMYDYGSVKKNMMHYNMDGLLAKIPRKYLIQNNELQDFNHFDFVWSIHAADQIYKPIIEVIRNDKTKI